MDDLAVQFYKLMDLRGEQQDSLWVRKEDYDALAARILIENGVTVAPVVQSPDANA